MRRSEEVGIGEEAKWEAKMMKHWLKQTSEEIGGPRDQPGRLRLEETLPSLATSETASKALDGPRSNNSTIHACSGEE